MQLDKNLNTRKKDYIKALKLSTQIWIWLFKNSDKGKEDSPYWEEIKYYLGNCPLCSFYYYYKLESVKNICINCILYEKRCCFHEEKFEFAYYRWCTYKIEVSYIAKLAAARIASVLRREYEKLTGDKNSFRGKG